VAFSQLFSASAHALLIAASRQTTGVMRYGDLTGELPGDFESDSNGHGADF